MTASQTKSPYPSSAFESIGRVLVVCLAPMLPFDVQASDEEAGWRISETSRSVRYTAHGTVVHGHQFGFVKVVRQCNADLLWLSWSSINPEVKKLIGSKFTFLIDVDGRKSEIAAKLANAFTLTPGTTITVFSNFHVGPEFIDLLGRSRKIEITIGGPQDAKELFDVPVDNFALIGFEAARRQAKKACEAESASNGAPLRFGSLEFPGKIGTHTIKKIQEIQGHTLTRSIQMACVPD